MTLKHNKNKQSHTNLVCNLLKMKCRHPGLLNNTNKTINDSDNLKKKLVYKIGYFRINITLTIDVLNFA